MRRDRNTALQAELRAIELWNSLFESDPTDQMYSDGLECRQRRTVEIMAELSKNDGEQRLQAEPEHRPPDRPAVLCTLAHTLQNKLSVILGQCDLLAENLSGNPDCSRRLQSIRDAAQEMSETITERECPGGAH